jgi:hypothetical protein
MPKRKQTAEEVDRVIFDKVYLPAFIKLAEQKGLRIDTSKLAIAGARKTIIRKRAAADEILRQAMICINKGDAELARSVEAMLRDPETWAAMQSMAERESKRR